MVRVQLERKRRSRPAKGKIASSKDGRARASEHACERRMEWKRRWQSITPVSTTTEAWSARIRTTVLVQRCSKVAKGIGAVSELTQFDRTTTTTATGSRRWRARDSPTMDSMWCIGEHSMSHLLEPLVGR